MKYNAVYTCPLCGKNIIADDIVVDGAKRDDENRGEWGGIIYKTWIFPHERLDLTHTLCFCDNGRVGYAHFSGFEPLEKAED